MHQGPDALLFVVSHQGSWVTSVRPEVAVGGRTQTLAGSVRPVHPASGLARHPAVLVHPAVAADLDGTGPPQRTRNDAGLEELQALETRRDLLRAAQDVGHVALLVADLDGLVVGLTGVAAVVAGERSEEHTSELQSRGQLVCRLL